MNDQSIAVASLIAGIASIACGMPAYPGLTDLRLAAAVGGYTRGGIFTSVALRRTADTGIVAGQCNPRKG